jgi:hypothetical protein
MQPVVESLSSVCKNYLAMEDENNRLATELVEVRRKCFFHAYCLYLLVGKPTCSRDEWSL